MATPRIPEDQKKKTWFQEATGETKVQFVKRLEGLGRVRQFYKAREQEREQATRAATEALHGARELNEDDKKAIAKIAWLNAAKLFPLDIAPAVVDDLPPEPRQKGRTKQQATRDRLEKSGEVLTEVERRQATILQDMEWVYQHFQVTAAKLKFPSPGCRALWEWAVGNQGKFLTQYIDIATKSMKDQQKDNKEDDGVPEGLIDQILQDNPARSAGEP